MPDLSPHPPSAAVRSRAALVVTAIVFVVLAYRQVAFVHRYAVQVLYWDAWDLYEPLFRGQGWWASFDLQHGPHRQGLGGLLMRGTAALTRWDARADAAAVSWTLILATPLGLLLAWRCGLRGWPLVGVPVVYLNARQYVFFIGSANPAHGALPVLLLTLVGLAWFARSTAVRLSFLVTLTAAAIFTGFGLFVGLLTPAVLAVEAVAATRAGDRRRAVAIVIAIAATAAAWVAFGYGYHPDSAGEHFRFPFERPVEYLYFIGVMAANFVGVAAWDTGPGPGTISVGLVIAAVVLWVCISRGRRVVRAGVTGDRVSVVAFCLAAFGVIFATQAAVGRTPEGWQTGAVSRYVTLCVPAALAVLLHLSLRPGRNGRRLAVVSAGLLAFGTVTLPDNDVRSCDGLHDGCVRWAAACRKTHDQAAADRLARFPIYPKPTLASRLAFLEQHQLNLFAPTPRGTGER